jgi:hypothetical protein
MLWRRCCEWWMFEMMASYRQRRVGGVEGTNIKTLQVPLVILAEWLSGNGVEPICQVIDDCGVYGISDHPTNDW